MNRTRLTLLAEIEEFLARHGMAPTAFGVEAVNDGHLVHNLRAGGDVRTAKIDRIRAFMESFEGNGRKAQSSRGGHVAA